MKPYFIVIAFIAITLSACHSEGYADIYRESSSKVVEIRATDNGIVSFGTGTLISKDGYVIANKHVLQYENGNGTNFYNQIEVRLISSTDFIQTNLIGVSSSYDLGLIKIDGIVDSYSFYSDFKESFSPGDLVFTLGNAYGTGISFFSGYIASDYIIVVDNDTDILAIPTDIPISSGCSGAPLYNSSLQLLGIMSFVLTDIDGSVVQGLSFAIPAVSIIAFLGEQGLFY